MAHGAGRDVEPAQVLDDRLLVLALFLARVGVVEAEQQPALVPRVRVTARARARARARDRARVRARGRARARARARGRVRRRPSYCVAKCALSMAALTCPMWRWPDGSGGKRVTTAPIVAPLSSKSSEPASFETPKKS